MNYRGNVARLAGALLALLVFCVSCGGKKESRTRDLTVFHAACFAPVMSAIRRDIENDLKIRFRTEPSGSQVVCRKVTELGRDCDIMMLADGRLFKQIASEYCTWRIDFAHDEIVLGVGIRAIKIDEAEEDWIAVLKDDDVVLGRVDESLAPIGYRTLLVWKLAEELGHPRLMTQLRARSDKVVNDVAHLAALLSSGDIHYGFLYRSTCVNYDIRYIPLDSRINLGDVSADYSHAEITLRQSASSARRTAIFKGSPITHGLTIPIGAPHRERAVEAVRYLLCEKAETFREHGFSTFTPRFYGPEADFGPFEGFTEYAGEF